MLQQIASAARKHRKLATRTAWGFLAVSAIQVASVVFLHWNDPGNAVSLFFADDWTAWGLTYGGSLGVLWALLQTITLTVAGSMTLIGKPSTKKLGHAVLVGWASLWLLNIGVLNMVEPTAISVVMLGAMVACFIATILRGSNAWLPAPTAPRHLRENPPAPSTLHQTPASIDGAVVGSIGAAKAKHETTKKKTRGSKILAPFKGAARITNRVASGAVNRSKNAMAFATRPFRKSSTKTAKQDAVAEGFAPAAPLPAEPPVKDGPWQELREHGSGVGRALKSLAALGWHAVQGKATKAGQRSTAYLRDKGVLPGKTNHDVPVSAEAVSKAA